MESDINNEIQLIGEHWDGSDINNKIQPIGEHWDGERY